MYRSLLKYAGLITLLIFVYGTVSAQCDPMGPEECPDPEENGEICPDTLPIGYVNQLYSEVATILVPEQDTTGVDLHHLHLIEVGNLPTGISWVSNSPDDEFMAGNYYCILMEGTPEDTGTFYLRIVIDIYISILGFPILAGQVTDSTSLSMIIVDNTGMAENSIHINGSYPNPFTDWSSIRYNIEQPGEVIFEVYSLLGEMVHEQKTYAHRGDNVILFNGENFSPGLYLYVLKSGNLRVTNRMIRSE